MTDRLAEQATAAAVRRLAMADVTVGDGRDIRPAVLTACSNAVSPLEAADSEADYLREVYQGAAAEYDRERL